VFAFKRTGFYPITGAAIALELRLLRHSVIHLVERIGDPHSHINKGNPRTTKKTYTFLKHDSSPLPQLWGPLCWAPRSFLLAVSRKKRERIAVGLCPHLQRLWKAC